MSLINEALKKAQKQRTGETPLASMPAIGGESAERIARRSKPSGSNSLLLGLGIGVAGLAVVIIGVVMFLRKPPTPQRPAIIAQEHMVRPAEPVAPPVTPPVAAPTIVVPSAPAPALVAPPKIETPVVKVETKIAPPPIAVAPVTPKPEPVKPAPPGKLEPRAINFIESLRVAGIRASATDSKVLMNDRVYRIGSIVEHEMGLKLTGITSSSLTFEDENGGSYTRTF